MIDYTYAELFTQSSIPKEYIITNGDDITITNAMIPSEDFKLVMPLCTRDSLTYGACEANHIEFTTTHTGSLVGQVLSVSVILDGHDDAPFALGTYIVDSDKLSSTRDSRKVIAYDALYTVFNKDMMNWYNNLVLPMSVKDYRDALFTFLEIEQEETELINDDVLVNYHSYSQLSGMDVILPICEINACFGTIGFDGVFHYIQLKPIDTQEHTPADNTDEGEVEYTITKSLQESTSYEDYVCHMVTQVRAKNGSGEIIGVVGEDFSNPYTITNNPILDGLSDADVVSTLTTFFDAIVNIWYTINDTKCIGNPCLELGDRIKIKTKNGATLYTYLLNRTITGCIKLTDEIKPEGTEYYSEDLNSISSQISSAVASSTENRIVFLHYTNTDAITFIDGAQMTRLLTIRVVTTHETDLLFMAEAKIDNTRVSRETITYEGSIDDTDAVIKLSQYKPSKIQVFYDWNDTLFEYTPEDTYDSDGNQLLNLIFTIPNVAKNTVGEFKAYIKITDGNGVIDAYDLKAFILAQGAKVDVAWDGRLNIEEEIGTIKPIDVVRKFTLSESVSVNPATPTKKNLGQNVALIKPSYTPLLCTIEDTGISFGYIIKSATRLAKNTGDWVYDTNYIQVVNEQLIFKNRINKVTQTESIDEGYLVSVEFPTNDMSSISNITYTEVI